MAISIGATSEQLLRGIDRAITSVAMALPGGSVRAVAPIPKAWKAERGIDVASTRVTIAGGFPGSLRHQHVLPRTTLHLTDRWLIVGEGTPTGFALPLERIDGCSVQFSSGLQPPYMVMWYRDGAMTGSFSIAFEGTARNRIGKLRAEIWRDLLQEYGVIAIETEIAAFVPSIFRPWCDADTFAGDDVSFSEVAIASAGGRFGEQLDIADVWITENWILWCPRHGIGMNAIAIDQIAECRNGYGDRLSIGIEDACGGRYDIYFDFGAENQRSRLGMQVLDTLATAGIPVGTASQPIAPWRRGGTRPPAVD